MRLHIQPPKAPLFVLYFYTVVPWNDLNEHYHIMLICASQFFDSTGPVCIKQLVEG